MVFSQPFFSLALSLSLRHSEAGVCNTSFVQCSLAGLTFIGTHIKCDGQIEPSIVILPLSLSLSFDGNFKTADFLALQDMLFLSCLASALMCTVTADFPIYAWIWAVA